MNCLDLRAISALLILFAAPVAVLLAAGFFRRHWLTCLMTLAGLAGAFASLRGVAAGATRQVTPLLLMDPPGAFYIAMILAGAFAVAAMSYGYFDGYLGRRDEFYVLLLTATLGASVMAVSSHFASFFVALEVLSVSLYGLVAYLRRPAHIEAGMKYLILAAVSSAFLVFGMALIYGDTGTLEFARLAGRLGQGALTLVPVNPAASVASVHGALASAPEHSLLVLAGLALLMVGAGFKLAAFPFHLWTPDVYEGAPAPATAFVATVSKAGMVGLLIRFLTTVNILSFPSLRLGLALMAAASMFAGNWLALTQTNLKRLLAYSSIAHLGYLLVGFVAAGPAGSVAATAYMAAYLATSLGSFGVITLLSSHAGDLDRLEDYAGLAWRRPWLAAVLTSMMLSLAGMPLTAGFIGKYYVVSAGIQSSLWWLVIVLAVNSAIGVYYYLRVVMTLFRPESSSAALQPAGWLGGGRPGRGHGVPFLVRGLPRAFRSAHPIRGFHLDRLIWYNCLYDH